MSQASAAPSPLAAPGPFTAALIDLDGTLIDRDAAIDRWLRAHLEGEAPARGPRGQHAGLEELAAQILASHRKIEAGTAEQLARRIRAELPDFIGPDARILAALDRLAEAGVAMVLVSNGGGTTQRAKLAAAAIDPARFESVLISGEFGVAKPDARIFAAALAVLGHRGAGAWMIGDSPEHDVAGARAAALPCCWISRGQSWSARRAAPRRRAPDFPAAVVALLEARAIDTAEPER